MYVDAYDFDKTIYDGDSSVDFYVFCLKRHKKIILGIFKLTIFYILYFFKLVHKTKVKEVFFSFLSKIDNISLEVDKFWEVNKNKIKTFYLSNDNHNNDIIISASPEFLLEPICKKLGVKDLIASKVNNKTGKFLSENCKGIEKVNRLKNKYKDIIINNFYTDSYSDKPLIDISNNAYIVNKNKITKIK